MNSRAALSCVRFTRDALFDALSNEHCSADEIALKRPCAHLYKHLSESDARTIVIESDYIDRDYLEDFAEYYVRCFAAYGSHCRRLHFFRSEVSEGLLRECVLARNADAAQRLQEAYLGFSVVRPLPDAVVGRTLLQPREGAGAEHPVRRSYVADLYGLPLSIESLPFQEQDTVLAACATVALWSAFNRTAVVFGSLSPSPAKITRMANEVVNAGRPIPSHGLIVEQMSRAIRQVGLEPELFRVTPDLAVPSLVYAYLKEGYPLILGVRVEGMGLHAMALVGYTLQREPQLQREVRDESVSPPMLGLRISSLCAHDDQVGPFALMDVKPGSDQPVILTGEWKHRDTGKPLELCPVVLIAPVYHKVRITFVDMQKWLKRISDILPLFGSDVEGEWELWLSDLTTTRRSIRNSHMPDHVRAILLFQNQPKYLWRAVLRIGGLEVVELFADATDMDRSLPIYSAIWHDSRYKHALAHYVETSASLKDLLRKLLSDRLLQCLLDAHAVE